MLLAATVSNAHAHPGSVPATARLYTQASKSSPVVATLPAKAALEIIACNEKWCKVTAQSKTGWVERPLIKARYGRCTELSKIGLFDIRRNEPSYTPGLDRDNDGTPFRAW
ncbi:SH3 domain-containing protein [Deinococcus sp. AJ005]|uniref:SH3 domain-containing protein n=1 Tax=Deinococcus sp. AJ005 TaxID=2652443 RepID=UPI00125CBD72|nr:SH3 domain-containing protein [Deinococcus sp. AJ005]QFP76494.1 SH3 domain-containing protein [Deinococcus sp. AJ005]